MKIMAIDYGDAHTGIAISDVTGTLAGFTTVIDSRKAEVVVQEILRLLPERKSSARLGERYCSGKCPGAFTCSTDERADRKVS